LLFVSHGPAFLFLVAGVMATIIICSLLKLITVGSTRLPP
jgi:hypothetical protein